MNPVGHSQDHPSSNYVDRHYRITDKELEQKPLHLRMLTSAATAEMNVTGRGNNVIITMFPFHATSNKRLAGKPDQYWKGRQQLLNVKNLFSYKLFQEKDFMKFNRQ